MERIEWDDPKHGEEAVVCDPKYHDKKRYYGAAAYRAVMDGDSGKSKGQASLFEAKVQEIYKSSGNTKYSTAFNGRSRSIALVKDYWEAFVQVAGLKVAGLDAGAAYSPTEPSKNAIEKLWEQRVDGKGNLVVLRLERGKGKGLAGFVTKIQKKLQEAQEKAGGHRFAVLCSSDTGGQSDGKDPLKFKKQLDEQDKSFLKVRALRVCVCACRVRSSSFSLSSLFTKLSVIVAFNILNNQILLALSDKSSTGPPPFFFFNAEITGLARR